MYVTFRLNFHHFDRFELDMRGHAQVRGAASSCLRFKLGDLVADLTFLRHFLASGLLDLGRHRHRDRRGFGRQDDQVH